MGRLGTETAFEVLARARALERRARRSSTSRSASPTSTRRRTSRRRPRRSRRAGRTTARPPACPSSARRSPRRRARRAASPCAENVVVTPGGKPIMFFAMLALLEEGDEVHLSEPGLPDLRVGRQLHRRRAGPLPLREERASTSTSTMSRSTSSRSEAAHPQLAAQSRPAACSTRASRGHRALARRAHFLILSDEIYARSCTRASASIPRCPAWRAHDLLDGFSKTYAMTGWRLGFGIMEKRSPARRAADDELQLLHRDVHAAGRHGRAAAAQTGSRRWSRSSAAPRPHGRGPERAARHQLLAAARRLLRVPEHHRHRPACRAELADRAARARPASRLSGTAFGAHGEGYLRFSYANSENLSKALERMRPVFESVREVTAPRGSGRPPEPRPGRGSGGRPGPRPDTADAARRRHPRRRARPGRRHPHLRRSRRVPDVLVVGGRAARTQRGGGARRLRRLRAGRCHRGARDSRRAPRV